MSSGKARSSEFINVCRRMSTVTMLFHGAVAERLGRRMSTVTMLFHGAVAERLGLNPSDHKCGDLVREHGPLTAGRLAELTGLTTGAITGVIDRLEKAGFVAREADPHDRRKVLIRIVPESQKRMWPLFAGIAQGTKQVCDEYTEEQLALVMEVMEKLSVVTQQEVHKLRELPDAALDDATSDGGECAAPSEPVAPQPTESRTKRPRK